MTETLLSTLFGRGEAPLALGAAGPISADAVLRQAGVIAAQLPDPTPGSEVAFSFERDRVACAAALIATWARGHAAALPEDGTKDNIVPLLARKENVAFLHDTGVGLGLHVPTLLEEAAHGDALEWTPGSSGQPLLAAFTQPVFGEPAIASWNEADLLSLLADLAEHHSVPAGSHVVSSMTPTALPGLLLGLLVPAMRGATFEAATFSGAEALAFQVREHRAYSLIATPAHARALCGLSAGALGSLAAIFCVDEGLDTHSAERLASKHSLQVLGVPRLPLDPEPDEFVARLYETLFRFEAVEDLGAVVLRDEAGNPAQMLVTVVGAEDLVEQWRTIFGETTQLISRPSLVRDDNGRLPQWRTLLDFGYGRTGVALERNLAWTEAEPAESGIRRFRTRLPENYAFFEGHYTSYSVLAGAVQLHELALPCIRRVDPSATSLTRLSGLKFMSRIAPGDEIEVLVTRGSNEGDLRFEILAGGVRCSAGQLQFASPSEDPAQ